MDRNLNVYSKNYCNEINNSFKIPSLKINGLNNFANKILFEKYFSEIKI